MGTQVRCPSIRPRPSSGRGCLLGCTSMDARCSDRCRSGRPVHNHRPKIHTAHPSSMCRNRRRLRSEVIGARATRDPDHCCRQPERSGRARHWRSLPRTTTDPRYGGSLVRQTAQITAPTTTKINSIVRKTRTDRKLIACTSSSPQDTVREPARSPPWPQGVAASGYRRSSRARRAPTRL